jgi:hypothetical protein
MNKIRATIILTFILALGSSGIFLSSCKRNSVIGMILITQTSEKNQNTTCLTSDPSRYLPQSRIIVLNPDKPGNLIKVLTENFYSALSPDVSYDGSHLLFAAKQKQNDTWQIWEMNLENSDTRQITFSKENCIYPAYMPGGRLLFSQSIIKDSVNEGYSLFSCSLNGADIKRITFSSNSYYSSTLLKDGRILTISRQLSPAKKDPMFMVLRPDGTKAEMFYKGIEGSNQLCRGRETTNGKILFSESEQDSRGEEKLISINYNRPLNSRVNLTSEIKGSFHSVFPIRSGKLLVSYRPSDSDRYGLYEFDPEKKTIGNLIYNSADYDVLEAVVVEKHDRPKKLPSEVDMGVKTGLLLCQDINFFVMKSSGSGSATAKASRIEVIGRDSTLGIVPVAEDGSFYLKVVADTPFKIQTIDEKGRVIQGPCDWIWLRPNERRGCIGCHEDHELVPENRVPLSVKKAPVSIPVHINKVVEKKISLE